MDDQPSTCWDLARAFFDTHEKCPNRVESHIWLPKGLETASVTMTCACGGRVVIPCTRVEGRALLASYRLHGHAVTATDAPKGVH